MNKQTKIREELYWMVSGNGCDICGSGKDCKNCDERRENADEILNYLHKEGVVIKVDRELPDETDCPLDEPIASAVWLKEEFIKAGYAATEPLIGEKEDGR